MWCQFFGDTFPEMIFASAWSMLVTFFIQLVGIALGTGTNTSPGIVIQATVSAVIIIIIIAWHVICSIKCQKYHFIHLTIHCLFIGSIGLCCLFALGLHTTLQQCCICFALCIAVLHIRRLVWYGHILLSTTRGAVTAKSGTAWWSKSTLIDLYLAVYSHFLGTSHSVCETGCSPAEESLLVV